MDLDSVTLGLYSTQTSAMDSGEEQVVASPWGPMAILGGTAFGLAVLLVLLLYLGRKWRLKKLHQASASSKPNFCLQFPGSATHHRDGTSTWTSSKGRLIKRGDKMTGLVRSNAVTQDSSAESDSEETKHSRPLSLITLPLAQKLTPNISLTELNYGNSAPGFGRKQPSDMPLSLAEKGRYKTVLNSDGSTASGSSSVSAEGEELRMLRRRDPHGRKSDPPSYRETSQSQSHSLASQSTLSSMQLPTFGNSSLDHHLFEEEQESYADSLADVEAPIDAHLELRPNESTALCMITERETPRSTNLRSMKKLSRSMAALTASSLKQIWQPHTSKRRNASTETLHGMPSRSESVLDVTDVSSAYGDSEPPLSSASNVRGGGVLEVGLLYNIAARKMIVRIGELRWNSTAASSAHQNVQIRLVLLPDRKHKQKSKVKAAQEALNFEEHFVFGRVTADEVTSLGLRFRLYGWSKLRRERMLGESVIGFSSLSLNTEETAEQETRLYLNLEARPCLSRESSRGGLSSYSLGGLGRSSSGDSTPPSVGILPPRGGVPELLIGLAYNGTTGRLSMEIVKGSLLRSQCSSRAPDVVVKSVMYSSTGQELSRVKSSVRKGQTAPTFQETFVFPVALFQLPDVTLTLSTINKRALKRRELLGWLSFGLQSSSDDASTHWQEMRNANGEQTCRWHTLEPPINGLSTSTSLGD